MSLPITFCRYFFRRLSRLFFRCLSQRFFRAFFRCPFQCTDQFFQREFCISHQRKRILIMKSIIQIRIDIYYFSYIWISSARAIRLTDSPCTNSDKKISIFHGKIAADTSFRSTYPHAAWMLIGHYATCYWSVNTYSVY